jgi:hypothetical protein
MQNLLTTITTKLNPVISKTNNTERMQLMSDKAFLGIITSNPLATLQLHYQADIRSDHKLNLLQLTIGRTGSGSLLTQKMIIRQWIDSMLLIHRLRIILEYPITPLQKSK